ncbi:MAG: chitobiase/beta-hexosaminidase C-terminal domain-containing protein, partial [bacterium]
DGSIWTTIAVNPVSPELTYLAKAGLQWHIKKQFNKCHWYGKGPHETYPDRKTSGLIGEYAKTAKEMFHIYDVPQESGNRSDVRWFSVKNNKNKGLFITSGKPFHASAYPYDDNNIEKARHIHDLQKADWMTLNTDYRQVGLGTATCGPGTFEPYHLPAEELHFSFWLKAFNQQQNEWELYQNRTYQYPPDYIAKPDILYESLKFNSPIKIRLHSDNKNTVLRYTLDGSIPTEESPVYEEPLKLTETTTVKAMAFTKNNNSFSKTETFNFINAKKIDYSIAPMKQYTPEDTFALMDGAYGKPGINNEDWLGFDDDIQITIELAKRTNIQSITANFQQDKWAIFLPEEVIFQVSKNGKQYETTEIVKPDYKEEALKYQLSTKEISSEVNSNEISHIRLKIKNVGTVPEWHKQEGDETYVFIDEIKINKLVD